MITCKRQVGSYLDSWVTDGKIESIFESRAPVCLVPRTRIDIGEREQLILETSTTKPMDIPTVNTDSQTDDDSNSVNKRLGCNFQSMK